MTTLLDFIAELKLELTKRRQVWARIPGESVRFMDLEHQRRYEVLDDIKTFLEQMTPQEFAKVIDRIERKRTEAQNQYILFEPCNPTFPHSLGNTL